MRKIKFRAWDGTRFLNKTFFDRNWYNSDNKCVKALVPEDQHYLKIMQYTGLKDKNGKEIYEGDIILNPLYEEPYVVEYAENLAGYVGWGDDRICGCYLITDENIKIIGNIYENPELLK